MNLTPETVAVTKMILNNVAEIVYGNVNSSNTIPYQVKDQSFQNRPASHRDHGFGDRLGDRTQARSETACHNDRPVWPRNRADHFPHQVQANKFSITIENRNLADIT